MHKAYIILIIRMTDSSVIKSWNMTGLNYNIK